MGGKAFIHINGTEYQMDGQYTNADNAVFQNLVSRIQRLVTGAETQTQFFDVVIAGHKGQLMVQPGGLASAAVVFIPELDPASQVH
jgi:hypothetical protein